MSGLYPKFTGAWKNHGKLKKKVKTFANELKALKNYQTAYMGKFHLNGKTKSASDFGDKSRSFGFKNIEYQYNRGHWKYFNQTSNGLKAFEWKDREKFIQNGQEQEHYATDFLFDRAIEFMKLKSEKGKKFALMLSIADPHAPNDVRPPYSSMFDNLNFNVPPTAIKAMKRNPTPPDWAETDFHSELADEQIAAMESDLTRQNSLRNIFGMIKLVDDNVGKMMDFLDQSGLRRNTIVVFTSDHGDMMGEHGRDNKGVPYMSSAQVPFIIRWPRQINKGQVIETAYSSVDFVPTILGLMGVNSRIKSHGIDGSEEILSNTATNSNQIRFMTDSQKKSWAAAVNNRYKLVLSRDTPWLFDLQLDPDELYNYYTDPAYAEIAAEFQSALLDAMEQYKFTLPRKSYLPNPPVCWDSKDEIPDWPNTECKDLNSPDLFPACSYLDIVKESCPRVCGVCCEDSVGEVWLYGAMRTCAEMNDDALFCTQEPAQLFCPASCGLCN